MALEIQMHHKEVDHRRPRVRCLCVLKFSLFLFSATESLNVAAVQDAEDADNEFEDEFSDISEDNWAELERCEEENRRAKRAESLARKF